MYLYVRIGAWDILIKKQKQHPSAGNNASTAEAAPGGVGRGQQGEARRAETIRNGVPHLELGRLRLKPCSESDVSIAKTWPTYLYMYCITMYKRVFFAHGIVCSSYRGYFLVLSALGHGGSPPEHHGANVGPGRGPWHVLWRFKAASKHGEAFRARRAIQAHANYVQVQTNVGQLMRYPGS